MHSTTYDAQFWDRVAAKYARRPISDMAGYERTIERTRDLLAAGDDVLEIGCGTGTTALRLKPFVSRLVATDVSPEMIAIAREKAAAQDAVVDFQVAVADAAPGELGGFDAVLAFNLLHLVADRPATLRRIYGLLKPGGLFISKTPCLSEMNVLIRLAVPIARVLGKAPMVTFFRGEALETEIAVAGFSIVERARHGSGRKDPRIFIVGRKPLA